MGFKFDSAAVVVRGVAHAAICPLLPERLPPDGARFAAGGVSHAEFCPRVCPRCEPRFASLLSDELRSTALSPAGADTSATLGA